MSQLQITAFVFLLVALIFVRQYFFTIPRKREERCDVIRKCICEQFGAFKQDYGNTNLAINWVGAVLEKDLTRQYISIFDVGSPKVNLIEVVIDYDPKISLSVTILGEKPKIFTDSDDDLIGIYSLMYVLIVANNREHIRSS